MTRSLEIATSLLLFDLSKGNVGAIIPFYRWVNWDTKVRLLAQVTTITGSRSGTMRGHLSLSSTLSLNHTCLGEVGASPGGQLPEGASKESHGNGSSEGDTIFPSFLYNLSILSAAGCSCAPLTASMGKNYNWVTWRWLEMSFKLLFLGSKETVDIIALLRGLDLWSQIPRAPDLKWTYFSTEIVKWNQEALFGGLSHLAGILINSL